MTNLWAAEWHSKNNLDGITRYIMNENCLPKLFRTRRACREWITRDCGYIKYRKDLRAEPHGWRLPKAVKVMVNRLTGEQ